MADNITSEDQPLPEDDNKEGPTKWWEHYYVRYFVGTFIGVAIIFALRDRAVLSREVQSILPSFEKLTTAHTAAVAFVGLAYCYLASAPVLTLHAIRGDWNLAVGSKVFVWIKWVLSGVVGMAIIGSCFACHYPESAASLWWIAPLLLLLVVGGQTWLLWRSLSDGLNRVHEFSEKLADKRLAQKKLKRDYVESYRHLREHGNAKAIVICEILLGLVLSVAQTMTQFVIYIVIWLLPATMAWFVGTVTESRMK